MLHEYSADFEHDLMNGRYCIECERELDGNIPMHMRFCSSCAAETEVEIVHNYIGGLHVQAP